MILSDVTNTVLVPDSGAWSQATLPVKQGGLGIRSAVDIAPSAFLASSHASSELVSAILPSHLNSLPLPFIVSGLMNAYLPTIQGFPGLSRDLGICPGVQGFSPFVQGFWDF